jgi:hypothetical protein
VADQTRRYRAASHHVYSTAIVALVEYARRSSEDFTFEPLALDALEAQGLAVTGPDLAGVSDVLSRVPGLVRSDE